MWCTSGDSHFLEPASLYGDNLPAELADRLPRSEKDPDGQHETVFVDGQTFRRRLPSPRVAAAAEENRRLTTPPGAFSGEVRLGDLDEQGVWGEVCYPSLGLWYGMITDAELVAAAARVLNEYVATELIDRSPRFVPTATLPLQSIELSIEELRWAKRRGFHAIFLPTAPPPEMGNWNEDQWEPLWTAAEEEGLVLGFHIGTDGKPQKYKNPGGALVNYVETTFGGARATAMLVASGALERHPDLKVLISEGGAAWAPFFADRMNESYRQVPMYNDGRITREPGEYVFRQVYASFQHDVTAVPAFLHMGYKNVMFGTDYPHIEGTFPHTQKVLHELFDGVDEEAVDRITMGAFLELFPHVGRPPAGQAA